MYIKNIDFYQILKRMPINYIHSIQIAYFSAMVFISILQYVKICNFIIYLTTTTDNAYITS